MKISERMTRILCYGDSNTWGQKPFKFERLKSTERWTGILQTKLDGLKLNAYNSEFEVVEEGLCGRLAGNIEFDEPFRNGLEYFTSNLLSQYPLEFVIISLGTNDLKTKFNRRSKQIVDDLVKYDDLAIKLLGDQVPNFIFITPPLITKDFEAFEDYENKAKKIAILLGEQAKQNNFDLVDLSDLEITGEDGVHFSLQNHGEVASRVFRLIQSYT